MVSVALCLRICGTGLGHQEEKGRGLIRGLARIYPLNISLLGAEQEPGFTALVGETSGFPDLPMRVYLGL